MDNVGIFLFINNWCCCDRNDLLYVRVCYMDPCECFFSHTAAVGASDDGFLFIPTFFSDTMICVRQHSSHTLYIDTPFHFQVQ